VTTFFRRRAGCDSVDIEHAYSRFCDLVSLAEESAEEGELAAAAALAQLAAHAAWPGNNGLFVSARLERLLLVLGSRMPDGPSSGPAQGASGKRRVLHVLTYARNIGGDTRFVWRWINADRGNEHSVVITCQDYLTQEQVPEVLRESAARAGGFCKVLGAPAWRPLDRAAELRALSRGMDTVVLHLWPYDAVPVLAFAAGCDPDMRVVFVNHSDHTFWLGASVSHWVVNLRRQSEPFLTAQRGLDTERSSILPIPLEPPPSGICREAARRSLGYAGNSVLILTIASPFKYEVKGYGSFLKLVGPVIAKHRNAVLLAVGPEDTGSWREARLSSGGRIVPLGRRWDNDAFYAAADIYLDSVPFSSITSLLEAGSRGLPLLGLGAPDGNLWALGPGAPGLEEAMYVEGDAASYRARLSLLIDDTDYRSRVAGRVQDKIQGLHCGEHWLRALDDTYAKLGQATRQGCLLRGSDRMERGALNMALRALYADKEFMPRMGKLVRDYIGALPYRERAALTLRLHTRGLGLCGWNFVPPPADSILRDARIRLKSIWQRALAASGVVERPRALPPPAREAGPK
jgi:hypothetical protein